MEPVLIVLIVFGTVPAIVGIALYFSHKNRKAILDTVSEAARNGQQLTPEVIRALGMPKKTTGNADLKVGSILLAIGVSFIVVGGAFHSMWNWDNGFSFLALGVGIGAFPASVGAVLVAFGLAAKKSERQEAMA